MTAIIFAETREDAKHVADMLGLPDWVHPCVLDDMPAMVSRVVFVEGWAESIEQGPDLLVHLPPAIEPLHLTRVQPVRPAPFIDPIAVDAEAARIEAEPAPTPWQQFWRWLRG